MTQLSHNTFTLEWDIVHPDALITRHYVSYQSITSFHHQFEVSTCQVTLAVQTLLNDEQPNQRHNPQKINAQ